MNLKKAVEIQTVYLEGSDEAEPVDFDNAIKLGVEALKHIDYCRSGTFDSPFELLPGETKD